MSILDSFLRLLGLQRKAVADEWEQIAEFYNKQSMDTFRFSREHEKNLLKELNKAEKEIEELNHKLWVRRRMTPQFDELQHFKTKKWRRFDYILKNYKQKRLDHMCKLAKNMGLELTIKIIDKQDPPRHDPVEITV